MLLVGNDRYRHVLINFKGEQRLIRYRDLDILERRAVVHDIQLQVAVGRLSFGKAIRRLRTDVMGIPQDVFAMICKMSTRTLADLEAGVGNPSVRLIEAVFRLFGIRLSLEMTSAIGNQEQLINRISLLGLRVTPVDSETP